MKYACISQSVLYIYLITCTRQCLKFLQVATSRRPYTEQSILIDVPFPPHLPDKVAKPSKGGENEDVRVDVSQACKPTLERRIATVQKITPRLCQVRCSYDQNANMCLISLQDLTSKPLSELLVLAVTLERWDCVRTFQLQPGHDYKVEVKACHVTLGSGNPTNISEVFSRLQYKVVTKETFLFCAGEYELYFSRIYWSKMSVSEFNQVCSLMYNSIGWLATGLMQYHLSGKDRLTCSDESIQS